MFNIGDKVVYPMHGAGIIETIEEKEILGEKHKYYILKIPAGDMRVMIPIEKTDLLGIRKIISQQEVESILKNLSEGPTDMSKNWTKRYKENEQKIKGGKLKEVAEVVRNLVIADRSKRLSTGEKKILTNAKQILISELMMAMDLNEKETEVMINDIIMDKTTLSDNLTEEITN